MKKTYEEVLLDPNYSYNKIIKLQSMPPHLYKYQSFYTKELQENKYWRSNIINGEFHLSLGSEFEDQNDCKPSFNKKEIWRIIKELLDKSENATAEHIEEIHATFDNILTQEYFEHVIANYQNSIRIGCFTASPENIAMWKKYANDETGFCIEYATNKNELFMNSTLPVLYLDTPCDISLSIATHIILECSRKAKKRSVEENFEIFKDIIEKNIKITYLPVFIKERKKWCFEQEYRMFLLKKRSTDIGTLKAEDILDNHFNINLSDAITSIYLGAKFDKNLDSDKIKQEIVEFAKSMKIKIFQREIVAGKYTCNRII